MSRGDELFEFLGGVGPGPAVDDDAVGEAANDLLAEFGRGYPLERLRVLLHSANTSTVKTGVFILSELGVGAAPLVDEVPTLLNHDLMYVRYLALDPALVATGPDDGEVIAQMVAMVVSDPDAAVRRKAMRFVARLTDDQRAAARQHLREDTLQRLMGWLEGADPAAITARLTDDDQLARRFAGIAAARVANTDGGSDLLDLAATSPDEALATFAQRELALPIRHRRRGR